MTSTQRDTLDHLRTLKHDWDTYCGAPISERAIETVRLILSYAHAASIVPTSKGGLQLEWHLDGIDLEIEVGPDGHIVDGY